MKKKNRINYNSPDEIRNISVQNKINIRVSALSNYDDDVWDFRREIPNINKKPGQKKIRWNRAINVKERRITNSEYSKLIISSKDFIFSYMSFRGKGNRFPKTLSVIEQSYHLFFLMKWMVAEGYWQFSQLDRDACRRFQGYVIGLPQSHSYRSSILKVLEKIFQLRHRINDGIKEHPFDYETVRSQLGVTHAKIVANKNVRIPEKIVVDLIHKALECIEKSSFIFDLRDSIEKIKYDGTNRNQHPDHIRHKAADYLKKHGVISARVFLKEQILLRSACYIIIAFFSGMRNSEILGIQENCISEFKNLNGNSIYKIFSIIYKTRIQPTKEYWIVPHIVKIAVDVLARLTAPLRKKTGLKELFISRNSRSDYAVLSNEVCNDSLNKFMAYSDIGFYMGKRWHLQTHQFRYSFAYYMIKENRCHLKFLQKQFKHLSMDMTVWYAETTDEDLKRDVYEMSADIARDILRPILLGREHLAGKGGAEIMQTRDAYFSGKTIKEKESLFEEMIKELYVRGTYLGLCIWNPEKATCNAGFECSCNPNICSNAIVTQEHLPIWLRLKERHEKLLAQKDLEPLKRQYIQNQMDTFVMPVLKSLSYKEGACG